MKTMALFIWFGWISMHPTIVWKAKALLEIPRSTRSVSWKNLNDAKDCSQATLWMVEAVSAFSQHICHKVSLNESWGELSGPTQTGYRRKLMFQIRFTSNRAVYEWGDARNHTCFSTTLTGHERSVRIQVEGRHYGDSLKSVMTKPRGIMQQGTFA
jgi:hypothetical protein